MGSSSKTSKKPAVALSKVPSVKVLCEDLGFQHALLKDINKFIDAAHAWRKSYRTSDGTPGTQLLQWNQPAVQLDLKTMAERFLENNANAENERNGDRFWSPTRSWNHDSPIQYPDKRAEIVELLKQLFWKQNRYAANNNTYPKSTDGRESSRDISTPIRHAPQTTGKMMPPVSPKSGPKAAQYVRPGGAPERPHLTRSIDEPVEATPLTNSHVIDGFTEGLRPSVENERDIYEISDDDSTATTSKLPKSPAQSSKHARTEQCAGSRDAPPRKKKRLSVDESPKRRTDRKVVPRSRQGMVPYGPGDSFEELSPSPTRDQLLEPNVDTTRPKNPLRSQSATSETPSDSIPNGASSQHPVSKRPFAAPTAPMLPANDIDHLLTPLVEVSRSVEAPGLPSKSQVNSPILTEEDKNEENDNVERSRFGAVETPLPRPSENFVAFPTRAASTLQTGQETANEHSDKLQGISTDIGSLAEPHANHIASKSTPDKILTERGSSRASSHPVIEAGQEGPSIPNTPTQPLSNQRTVKASTEEIELKDKPQDHPQLLTAHQHSRSLSAEIGPSKPRSKTQVSLWIITREPRYTEERWDDGKFQGTQLLDFLEGISKVTQRDRIEKVKLTLRTPTFDTKLTVYKDAEDSWVAAKQKFVEKLKEAMAEAKIKRPNEPANYEIFVEPFYEQNVETSSKLEEDLAELEF